MMSGKYLTPTSSFPYTISKRLALMALPRRQYQEDEDKILKITPTGVRLSALTGRIRTERTNACAWPYVGRLIMLKQMYKEKFSRMRIQKIDRMIAAAGATIYTKLAKVNIMYRQTVQSPRELKAAPLKGMKKGWNDSDWRKHMEYISNIAIPKPNFQPPPVERGPSKPLSLLLVRIEELCRVPPTKMYKRESQDKWYKDPVQVKPLALKYVITERVKKLAEPKKQPVEEY